MNGKSVTENKDDLVKALSELYQKLESEQEPLEPEIQKVIDDNFWDLLIEK